MGADPDKPDFSDSTRKLLDEFAREREHEKWAREQRKKRFESVKSWAQWLTAIWAAKELLWDALRNFGIWPLK